jgi:hypothetical protein
MEEDGPAGPSGVSGGEREALLNEGDNGGPTFVDPDGVRHRGIPQGRAAAMRIFEAMADAEGVTGVPGVRPGEEEGSHNWMRAERYWKDKYESSRKAKVKNKFEAVLWLIAGFAVLNATDFIKVCALDPRVVRTALNVGLLAIVVMLCVIAYLIVWLSIVRGVDWDRIQNSSATSKHGKSPYRKSISRAVGLASGALVTSILSFPIAVWPVWHLWSAPILFVLTMAALQTLHFVPTFGA